MSVLDFKKHRWRTDERYKICVQCGCRYLRAIYRKSRYTRIYEWPDGRRTTIAENCPQQHVKALDLDNEDD